MRDLCRKIYAARALLLGGRRHRWLGEASFVIAVIFLPLFVSAVKFRLLFVTAVNLGPLFDTAVNSDRLFVSAVSLCLLFVRGDDHGQLFVSVVNCGQLFVGAVLAPLSSAGASLRSATYASSTATASFMCAIFSTFSSLTLARYPNEPELLPSSSSRRRTTPVPGCWMGS